MSNNIEVRVARVPGTVKSVILQSGATLANALEAADIRLAENEKADVNGVTQGTSHTLQDGDTVVIAASAKGN